MTIYMVMMMICDEGLEKIEELQTKLDIKDDALCALNLALDHAIEENRRLKEAQENTVKMLKAVLSILDRKFHL
jgi:hypothetical protein